MSSLKESLIARRNETVGPTAPSLSAPTPVPGVVVQASSGDHWTFPWAHFVFAQHGESGDRELIVLTFVSHQVHLRGVRLAPLMDAVAGFRLERLTDVPPKYRSQVPEGEPCIEEICVQAKADSAEPSME